MDGALAGSVLAKNLASCNKTTRDRAFRLLKTWLPSQGRVSDDEMKKIWKGLFYCVWHADKQKIQIELINRLASLLVSLDLPLSVHYFEVFLTTIRREWSGIDLLRLDKFYLLIRRFVNYFFLLLKKNSWDLELSSRLMCIWEEKTLLASDKYPAQGINYHVSEVFLEELKPFLPVRLEILGVLFKPFLSVMEKSSDKVFLNKIKSGIFDCLLRNGKKLLELKKAGKGVETGDEVNLFGTIALTLDLSVKFFNLGSSPECIQGNRKVLFGLHEEFLKLEKEMSNAGIEVSIPEVIGDNVDEVPDLIPITAQEVGATDVSLEVVDVEPAVSNGSVSKLSKKGKKAKKASKGTSKKAKTSMNGFASSVDSENGMDHNIHTANGENLNEDDEGKEKDRDGSENIATNDDPASDENLIPLSESLISNLQVQFEKVAAEVGMGEDGISAYGSPTSPVDSVSKKRKRSKNVDGQVSNSADLSNQGGSAAGKSVEKSAKKVRFSMKNNLVWKPHNPLPPQSLRLPPSATPRGSALKKGIPPGPIREIPSTTKKLKKRASSVKKARKGPKSVSPAIKRLRKLQSLSV
ncbi:PREDICTED: ribosomal RNA processing protein 1 homolog B [Nelumbo nucifera]|uniref:Ribosomal RNA processing protein 1 homolog B n=1 Tax=Nelumbo nucifera TaxID=4432 RepID=A0A1U8AEJ5_NELNU|nr:PREDICTED: ribosomal RNA processing protein 1 homolog B [Nelumbo nucifera]